MTQPARTLTRRGFTLIELLVVIAILAVLAALTAAVYMRITLVGPDFTNNTDIRELDQAVQNFKTWYGGLPPSRLKICRCFNPGDPVSVAKMYPNYQVPGTLDYDSVKFLTSGPFKRCAAQWANVSGPPTTWGIQWDNGLAWAHTDPSAPYWPPVILEGDQCLVFCLGGIPTVTTNGNNVILGCGGFSRNAANPADPSNREKPFYEFKSDRLTQRKSSFGYPFFSYLDAHKKNVYAYFSSYNKENGYNRYLSSPAVADVAFGSDCPTLAAGGPTASMGVWPYAQDLGSAAAAVQDKMVSAVPSAGHYQNAGTFQIISAGAKGVFGKGTGMYYDSNAKVWYVYKNTLWTPTTAGTVYPPNSDGADDRSNFHTLKLGDPS